MHFVLCFTVFSASRQCCPGGGRRGGAGTTVSSSDVFCLYPFALVFTVFFPLSHFFFCTICVFPWFLQCFQASWRCWCYAAHWGGVGWGNHVHVNLTNHVVEASSCCWCYRGDVNVPCNLLTLLMLRHAGVGGMLTFHVTCSRCWCYATLGWGGMLTFHVTCSRCWCYATLGWGWGRGSRLPLLSRGVFFVFLNMLWDWAAKYGGVCGATCAWKWM